MFDPATHYEIEVRGQVDVDWLRSFDSSVEIHADLAGQGEGHTVLTVQADQSGVVGLLRSLHGLGMTILQVRLVPGQGGGRSRRTTKLREAPSGNNEKELHLPGRSEGRPGAPEVDHGRADLAVCASDDHSLS